MSSLTCEIPNCESHKQVQSSKVPPGIELLVCAECREEFKNGAKET